MPRSVTGIPVTPKPSRSRSTRRCFRTTPSWNRDYRDLLTVFFAIHDPTTLNRQGADVGTQYRSAIFYHDEQQKEIAGQAMREIADASIWDSPIVTEVTPFDKFYLAEDYHQEYFALNSFQPYCRAVIAPKVSKFRKQFMDRLRKSQFQHG